MLIYYVYLDDDGNSKSASRFDASSDMQPLNNPRPSVECDRTTFSVVQEWKYDRRYKEGFDLPDEQYEAWLKINHPEDTRAGGNSDFQ